MWVRLEMLEKAENQLKVHGVVSSEGENDENGFAIIDRV